MTKPKASFCLAVAWTWLALVSGTARSDFMLEALPIPEPPVSQKFFIDLANKDVSSFSGHVGGNGVGPVVNVATAGNVDTGSGFANITPVKDSTLTSLTFTPQNPNGFEDFTFRGQLLAAGSVTITVQDNQGDPSQTFTITGLKANADFGRLGITAAGTGETIQSVTISSDGFKEVKQISFSSASPFVTSVPEPGSLTLLGVGAAGMAGYCWRRRKAAPA